MKTLKCLDCQGPLGFPMSSKVAKELELAIKEQSSEVRTAFKRGPIEGYMRAELKGPSEDLGDRQETSMVTTASIDRDNEVVLPTGLDWKQFKLNPVVTYAHRWDEIPVGKSLRVIRSKSKDPNQDGWKAVTKYVEKPEGWTGEWLPDAVWHLIKQGVLKGKSIGFLPLSIREPTSDDVRKRPELADARLIIEKGLVVEYAVISVQSNPTAIVEEVQKMLKGGMKFPVDLFLNSEPIEMDDPFVDGVVSSDTATLDVGITDNIVIVGGGLERSLLRAKRLGKLSRALSTVGK